MKKKILFGLWAGIFLFSFAKVQAQDAPMPEEVKMQDAPMPQELQMQDASIVPAPPFFLKNIRSEEDFNKLTPEQKKQAEEYFQENIPGPFLDPSEVEGMVICSDYHKFGSVQIDIEAGTTSISSGLSIPFQATIKNDNDYPIVDGAVYAKVFRLQSDQDEANAYGNHLVDQFFVKENISLSAKENKKIDFQWKIPSYAVSGEYQIAMFFTSAKKFNLLGLSFTDDVVGNVSRFQVKSELEENVEFNKNTVDLNGNNYHFDAYPPRFKEEDITVKAELTNITEKSQSIPISYKLYSWDGQLESNLLEAKAENIQLNPRETKQISYTITDKNHPVYYLVIEANYQDAKSILDIRAVRETQDQPRLNFVSVTKYPLKQNETNSLFVCAHNSGTKDVVDNNKIILTLLDENNKEIHQYKYEGQISGAVMGLKNDFIPKENYGSFTIKAELYNNNQLVDQAELKYDCQQLDKNLCSKPSIPSNGEDNYRQITKIIVITIILILLILSIVLIIFKRKSNINNPY